jgi:hypothetical protein
MFNEPDPPKRAHIVPDYCRVLILYPFTLLIPRKELLDLLPLVHRALRCRSIQGIYLDHQEDLKPIISAMKLIFVTLRSLRSRFFRGVPFIYHLLSRQIGEAWNAFSTPCSLAEDLDLDAFPTFDTFCPFAFLDDPLDQDESALIQCFKDAQACLLPFAALLPSTVLPLWEKLFEAVDMPIKSDLIAEAMLHFKNTIHPIARDAAMSESVLMRLDRLLTLSDIKWSILKAPKIRLDFFPVPVFVILSIEVEEKPTATSALS